MTLQEKQANLTVLGLQIESLTLQFNKLKTEIVKEMNSEAKPSNGKPVVNRVK